MENKTINILDTFAPWLNQLEYRNRQWHAHFFPNRIVVSNSLQTVAQEMVQHIMAEIIDLACEALNLPLEELRDGGRKQNKSDKRMALANVLIDNMGGKASQQTMARAIGWKTHAMIIHAYRQREVKEVQHQITKIYTRYPFLHNGYQNMR